MCISSLKYFFIYLRKDLSSNFYFWIRKIFKKIQNIKISRIFHPKILNLWIKTKKIATLTFFMHVYIFFDCCLKHHNMFICRLFLEILWKIFATQVQKFLLMLFWILLEKSGRISCVIFWYLFDFRISTDGRVNRISFLNYWWNLQHLLVTPVCAIWHGIYRNFIIFKKFQLNFGCYKLLLFQSQEIFKYLNAIEGLFFS
jgi:hypothetical protein